TLNHIKLHVNNIQESPFYHLNNLTKIELHHGGLRTIPASAFNLSGRNAVNELVIDLSFNQLDGSSFDSTTFTTPMAGSIRPINIDLSRNNIEFISKSVFSPFLTQNSGNSID